MNINKLSIRELEEILDNNTDYNAIYLNDPVEGYVLPNGKQAGYGDIQRRYQEKLEIYGPKHETDTKTVKVFRETPVYFDVAPIMKEDKLKDVNLSFLSEKDGKITEKKITIDELADAIHKIMSENAKVLNNNHSESENKPVNNTVNKPNKVTSIEDILKELDRLNPDADIDLIDNNKIVSNYIEELELPDGFYLDENKNITNKNSSNLDSFIKIEVIKRKVDTVIEDDDRIPDPKFLKGKAFYYKEYAKYKIKKKFRRFMPAFFKMEGGINAIESGISSIFGGSLATMNKIRNIEQDNIIAEASEPLSAKKIKSVSKEIKNLRKKLFDRDLIEKAHDQYESYIKLLDQSVTTLSDNSSKYALLEIKIKIVTGRMSLEDALSRIIKIGVDEIITNRLYEYMVEFNKTVDSKLSDGTILSTKLIDKQEGQYHRSDLNKALININNECKKKREELNRAMNENKFSKVEKTQVNNILYNSGVADIIAEIPDKKEENKDIDNSSADKKEDNVDELKKWLKNSSDQFKQDDIKKKTKKFKPRNVKADRKKSKKHFIRLGLKLVKKNKKKAI